MLGGLEGVLHLPVGDSHEGRAAVGSEYAPGSCTASFAGAKVWNFAKTNPWRRDRPGRA